MNIMEPVVWYIAFLFSATVHEAAHALAAKIGGDPTAYEGGQVSLDPIPHIKREPIGMVALPIISSFLIGWPFGYASAPYNPFWAHRHPHRAAWMALAGPASNFAIVILTIIIAKVGIFAGFLETPRYINFTNIVGAHNAFGLSGSLAFILSIFFTLNLVLAILNLFPLPPLDGSSVITLFMSEENAAKFQEITNNPVFGIIGLLIVWQFFGPVFSYIFRFIILLIY